MSLTNQVFPHSSNRLYWIYYTVTTAEEFSKVLRQTNPVVLMFSADWNEPCKVMKKPFRDIALARKNQAIFCVVDIDKLKDAVVQQFQVEALPTFVLFSRDGREKGRVVGAKVDDLKTSIQNLM